MKKNYYIAPEIRNIGYESEEMIAASQFGTATDDPKSLTVTNDEWDSEFQSRRNTTWDDEE